MLRFAPAIQSFSLMLPLVYGVSAENCLGQDSRSCISPLLPAPNTVEHAWKGARTVSYEPVLVGLMPRMTTFQMFEFPLPDGTTCDMELEEFRAYDPLGHFIAMQPAADGSGDLVEVPMTPSVRSFRGRIVGEPGSLCFLSFSEDLVAGFIDRASGTISISSGPSGEGPVVISDLAQLPEGAINWREFSCRTSGEPGLSNEGGVAALASCAAIDVAFETDNEFRDRFASDQQALDYVVQVVSGMNTIYYEDQNLFPLARFIRIWSAGTADPWNANGDSVDALEEFRTAWEGGGGPEGSTPRALAHFLSAKDLGGGVAFLSAVCDGSIGFAVSGNLSGFFPYPLQSNSQQNWDIVVTTHEMGHNCGCLHTHDIGVDGCGVGDCSSAASGTIMSYCNLCPGGLSNIRLNFATANIAQMDAFLSGIACVGYGDICPIFDPSRFSASDGDFVDGVRLTWADPALAAEFLRIERREVQIGAVPDCDSNDIVWDSIADVAPGEESFLDTAAEVDVVYQYRIQAFLSNPDVDGDGTDDVRPYFCDTGYVGVPGPIGLDASDGTGVSVTLVWLPPITDLYDPLCYRVERRTLSGDWGTIGDTSDLVFEDSTVTPGILYEYGVRAYREDPCGLDDPNSLVSAPSRDTGFALPLGASNLEVTGDCGADQNDDSQPLTNRIRLTWSLPAAPVTRVYIYRSENDGPMELRAILAGPSNTWSDLSAFADVPYTYSVRAFQPLLGLSAPTEVECGFRLEPPITTRVTEGTEDSVTIRWKRPSGWQPAGYSVWRKLVGRDPWPDVPLVAGLSPNQISFEDTSVLNGLAYVYAVTGYSEVFDTDSLRGNTMLGYPRVLAPTAVQATDGTSAGFVSVSWTATGASSGVRWQVERRRSGSGAPFTVLFTSTIPSYLDASAAPGTVYEYQVRTVCNNGVISDPSDSDTGFRAP